MSVATWYTGDVFDVMAGIPDGSVDLVVTSPPFLALRSYLPAGHPDKAKEIGSEATPAAFLSTLLALTREWRRILAPHGSICVELGDTYSGTGGDNHLYEGSNPAAGFNGSKDHGALPGRKRATSSGWPLDKSLCLLPTLYPASLAYGWNMLNPDDHIDPWRIRNLIVWHRPNPPVGALGDKVRPSTSYVTIACMRRDRWFDLDAERTAPKSGEAGGVLADNRRTIGYRGSQSSGAENKPRSQTYRDQPHLVSDPAGAPPLDWWQLPEDDPAEHQSWTIPTQPYAGSHYATFPIALPRRLIRLMCPMHVCRTCGEPRRRYGSASFTLQTELATHIKERRSALGVKPDEVNGWFGYKEIARNWERTDDGARVPDAKDWPELKRRLGLADRFDEFVLSRDPNHITYADVGSVRADRAERVHESPRPMFNAATRVASTRWTDCGHDNYRRGKVLDPFAGSGTTLAAATEQGRDAIGIGIDLDADNLELARMRVGMFLEEAV